MLIHQHLPLSWITLDVILVVIVPSQNACPLSFLQSNDRFVIIMSLPILDILEYHRFLHQGVLHNFIFMNHLLFELFDINNMHVFKIAHFAMNSLKYKLLCSCLQARIFT